MSHEFLTSLHSQVIGGPEEKTAGKFLSKSGARASKGKSVRKNAVTDEARHRTVGVSMSPQLQARAAARANEVRLSFSRYVQWCVEAELDGVPLASRFQSPSE
jgi:hypothetical protein